MSRRKKKPSAQCYLCGRWCNSPTDDHVPPECLAPNAPQSDFIKLPACRTCNNSYQHQESKFRDFLAHAAAYKGNSSADAAYSAFLRNISRNEIARAGRPHKDLVRVRSNMGIAHQYTPSGMYLGSVHFVQPASDVDVAGILTKIAKGVHYYHTQTFIPRGYRVYVEQLGPENSTLFSQSEAFEDMMYQRRGNFFEYWGGFAREDPTIGIWLLGFYQTLYALVAFDFPEAAPPPESENSSALPMPSSFSERDTRQDNAN